MEKAITNIKFYKIDNIIGFLIIYVLNTTIMSECKQCNQKPASKGQYLTIAIGVYLLGASIYGTIQMIKDLISLF